MDGKVKIDIDTDKNSAVKVHTVACSAAKNRQVDTCTLADQDAIQGPQKVIFTMYKLLLKQTEIGERKM